MRVSSETKKVRRFRVVGRDEEPFAGESVTSSLTLEALSRMSEGALEDAYRWSETPSDVEGLNGALSGRLLTLSGPLGVGPARRLTRRIACSRRFPWEGKTFQSWASARGSGVNRVRLLGERLWFHFETRLAPSALDGEPCIVLDYGGDQNPWPVRQVRDELRQVAPGLWMGPATFRGVVLLYFALTTHQVNP